MIEFESRLSTALRASFAAIDVPAAPSFLRPPQARRRTFAALLTFAAAIALCIAVKAEGPALARTFGQTLSFFVRTPDRDLPATVPAISFDAALRTPEFAVVRPAGLPRDARFVSAQRFSEHGTAPILAFNYLVHGRPLLLVESHERHPGDTWKPDPAEARSDARTVVRITNTCDLADCSGQMTMFRVGTTSVLIAASQGALSANPSERRAQIARIEAAMRHER